MTRFKNDFCNVVVIMFFVFIMGGCLSVPESQNPHFYMLQPLENDQIIQKFNLLPEAIIGIGPVKIPEYLNRPQIVTLNKDATMRFSEFDRWAESLNFLLAGVVRENLILMLPGAKFEIYPWNVAIPVKYQVMIEVVQFDARLEKDLFFVVQWSVFDINNKRMLAIKRSEFRQAIDQHNYSALVSAFNLECGSLSSQIAEEIAGFENKKE
ncbi:MAG: membrane integrity-associated transporter subunit PqiC [Candidatus Omnitrophica bacterium]|nr:membrane integrity-associated transporter subunit PqiC [Candidatus Omnitrophota bacterium]